ncbi:MAG: DinB family protein [Planctomycetes bacterium]|nr:DinB family protein [Planctomycetota bacterium]
MAHFYESLPASIRSLSNAEAIDAFLAGGDIPGRAISGLSDQHVDALPIPGTWSIRQIVVHLMDSDLVAAYRMKRIIAEERPLLDCYDETAFSKKLFYERQSAVEACEVIRRSRQLMTMILRQLPDGTFGRAARHPEIGEITLGQIVRLYVHHIQHHVAFIVKKRELLGVPITL